MTGILVRWRYFARVLTYMFFGGLVLVCALSFSAQAEPQKLDDLKLDNQARAAVLSDVASAVEARYLFKDWGARIAANLRSKKNAARLDQASPFAFARQTNSLLYELSGDRHLTVKWVPGKWVPGFLAAGDPAARRGIFDFEAREHGVRGARFLDGNVGLLTLDSFHNSAAARETLVAALVVLRRADALIFDFRGNKGGASDAVRLLQSCFFARPTLVMMYEDSPAKRTGSMSEAPPGDISCRDKPFFILTGAQTASAAEDFIYGARQAGHAVLVGQTTAGAAHFVDHIAIAPGFRLAVSVGRPVHPGTGTNWEGTGIVPDIETPEKDALAKAHLEALKALHGPAKGQYQRRLAYALNKAEARVVLARPDNSHLKTLARRYGPVRVTLTTDGLVMKYPHETKAALEPLGRDAFQVKGQAQAIFHVADNGTRTLELLHADGLHEIFEH